MTDTHPCSENFSLFFAHCLQMMPICLSLYMQTHAAYKYIYHVAKFMQLLLIGDVWTTLHTLTMLTVLLI